ncbi:response regulator [Caulobacter sp. KR2-114]|uniref:response regulator n=1 Tax=Caulobacter sp. KR2-114 TaxID=3400912 RepID=UPI003C0EC571
MTSTVTILVVEDEPLILDVLQAVLTDGGYEVVKAQDGAAALAVIEADVARFRAIITDVRLGSGPDGWAIAARAREIAPHLPVVYMTGDSTHEWASKGVPGSVVLSKPFAPAQLVTTVSTLVTEADQHAPPAPETGSNL